ncbi:3-dehydroquinate synthase [Candidatus Nitrosacidococcus tergens]|uniref:3-dehydroquinate synthase n=1 Tax=Candidatus Nitrosacidococcus tergens TaxID=553981 RepID=A0A7G1Q7V0_9GAMM|nr:3-dehydroquinate synthase [Candidatus Nitrosacidococcus tergens]CAB1274241.1 3-dehydroquinate synthase [Candidatus Nitrosacidococcus tergens]
MITLSIDIQDRSYPIYIGSNLLYQKSLLDRHIGGSEIVIVTNETIAPLYLSRVVNHLRDYRCTEIILPDGEQYKTLEGITPIFDKLLKNKFSRSTTLIALGGGVIGDMAGFAAACYQRGIPFIQIPTTLLAQVDSSVGGKTGVNHPLGKNMIGAFYQPLCVLADINTLNTLDERQFKAGIAEIIKYGLIQDFNFFLWLENHIDQLLARNQDILIQAIERSCQNKAAVVAADEKESGSRATLNLGHTFGHAIETGIGYGTWLHGEAVSVGMVMAANLSHQLSWLSHHDVNRITHLLTQVGLPIQPPKEMNTQRFLELMAVDKKVANGQLRLVLLKQLGAAVVTSDFPYSLLEETIEEFYRY